MREAIAQVMQLLAAGTLDRETALCLVRAMRMPSLDPSPNTRDLQSPIAVVGVSADLPGCDSIDEFWDVLLRGDDLVGPLPDARRELCEPVVRFGSRPTYQQGAWLSGVDQFDPAFFGVTPADARSMDPQQRRFFEVAHHCLEDAGWAGRIDGSRTGVFVAIADNDYAAADPSTSPSAVPGHVSAFAASRLSFFYDLRGPAYTVNATCASSLLAVHDACASLRAGDCEMALVGGVNIFAFPLVGEGWQMDQAGIMSVGARCRPFAEGADGIGRGEGVIALLLKPLDRAVADGDGVRAVIRGSAINNDGASATLTSPRAEAHAAVLIDAWRRAGLGRDGLSYLEAHGTGTELGDPIEVRGIALALNAETSRRQFLPIGSVKGNIGHLMDGAAGLSGLLKALLILEKGVVPPTRGIDLPSPHIDFLDSPVFVPTEPFDLRKATRPLRAGVSCFGFNGTNVHVVMEEAPRADEQDTSTQHATGLPFLYRLSAATMASLQRLVTAHARATLTASPADVVHTLAVGRRTQRHRVVVVARDNEEFRDACRALAGKEPAQWAEVPGVVTASPGGMLQDGEAGTRARIWVESGLLDQPTQGRVTPLPLYPFDHQAYWLAVGGARSVVTSALTMREPVSDDADTVTCCRVVASAVLGVDDVHADDNFVALGGSSLAALEVRARLSSQYGWDVPLVEILAADSLAELAEFIDRQRSAALREVEA
ncbi:surfactin family lipopeptide synthetase A [Branchiibius hedensis]|uniref:Ketoacyl-synthetase C-terminal extension n=1 Tax=Branchiibius hedensis TaxID=672460 RepID=A0A2Y9CAW8_9MICO|nr:type I polyketide synthase [Branchiibius hedensis]PWJ23327.1 surfactin family lipopeptide synthetase A [Branchiibius hedensis]SSA59016.1 Ketoacyl-synthetase C-terminal extension [Branchiibius hedensis]